MQVCLLTSSGLQCTYRYSATAPYSATQAYNVRAVLLRRTMYVQCYSGAQCTYTATQAHNVRTVQLRRTMYVQCFIAHRYRSCTVYPNWRYSLHWSVRAFNYTSGTVCSHVCVCVCVRLTTRAVQSAVTCVCIYSHWRYSLQSSVRASAQGPFPLSPSCNNLVPFLQQASFLQQPSFLVPSCNNLVPFLQQPSFLTPQQSATFSGNLRSSFLTPHQSATSRKLKTKVPDTTAIRDLFGKLKIKLSDTTPIRNLQETENQGS